MARIGGGCSEFFDTQKKSQWQGKVKEQLSKAYQPALTDVRVEWRQHDDNAPTPVQVRQDKNRENILNNFFVFSIGS